MLGIKDIYQPVNPYGFHIWQVSRNRWFYRPDKSGNTHMAYYPCLDNTVTATFQLECGLNEKTPYRLLKEWPLVQISVVVQEYFLSLSGLRFPTLSLFALWKLWFCFILWLLIFLVSFDWTSILPAQAPEPSSRSIWLDWTMLSFFMDGINDFRGILKLYMPGWYTFSCLGLGTFICPLMGSGVSQ